MSDEEKIEVIDGVLKGMGGQAQKAEDNNVMVFKAQMPHPIVIFLLVCILISSGMLLCKILINYETFTLNPIQKGMQDYNLERCICEMGNGEYVTIKDGMIKKQQHRFMKDETYEVNLESTDG